MSNIYTKLLTIPPSKLTVKQLDTMVDVVAESMLIHQHTNNKELWLECFSLYILYQTERKSR